MIEVIKQDLKTEALKLALEALEGNCTNPAADPEQAANKDAAITALRERLAQPWEKFCDTHCTAFDHHPDCKLAQPEQEHIIDCPRCGHCCPQPAQHQEPMAYDKTEINCFAQDLYDQNMREGKRGHYESMFYVIHQCIKKVSPPAQQPHCDDCGGFDPKCPLAQPSKPWVPLTEFDIDQIPYSCSHADSRLIAYAIEAKLREKNA